MKISVGIPVVKSKFLREALESWKNQTYRDFEAIIINDASKEECDAIVEPFLSDNRFHYIKRAHSSFPYFVRNWNECLKRATGEWFVLASDDDVYEKTFLEKMGGGRRTRCRLDSLSHDTTSSRRDIGKSKCAFSGV